MQTHQSHTSRMNQERQTRDAALQEAAEYKARLYAIQNSNEPQYHSLSEQKIANLEHRLAELTLKHNASLTEAEEARLAMSSREQHLQDVNRQYQQSNGRLEELEATAKKLTTENDALRKRNTEHEMHILNMQEETAALTSKASQYDTISSSNEGHLAALAAASDALSASRSQVDQLEQALRESAAARGESERLQNEVHLLERESMQARQQAEKLGQQLAQAHKENDSLRVLTDDHLSILMAKKEIGDTSRLRSAEQEILELKNILASNVKRLQDNDRISSEIRHRALRTDEQAAHSRRDLMQMAIKLKDSERQLSQSRTEADKSRTSLAELERSFASLTAEHSILAKNSGATSFNKQDSTASTSQEKGSPELLEKLEKLQRDHNEYVIVRLRAIHLSGLSLISDRAPKRATDDFGKRTLV